MHLPSNPLSWLSIFLFFLHVSEAHSSTKRRAVSSKNLPFGKRTSRNQFVLFPLRFYVFSLSISPPSQPISKLPTIFLFMCFSFESRLVISPSSFCHLVSLYIFSGPNCSLRPITSPPVSMSMQLFPTPTHTHKLVPHMSPTRFL